jgi:hypothetical protein
MNLKSSPSAKVAKGVTLGGHSKSWAGGGVNVTEANLVACRALLAAITKVAPAKVSPTASDAARVSATATAEASKRVAAVTAPAKVPTAA